MTDVLNMSAGRMIVKNTSGDVMLDTNDEIFHIIDFKSGTQNIPTLDIGGYGNTKTRSASYSLGSINSLCTHVFGFCQLTWSTGYSQLPSGMWYMVGGTMVPVLKRWEDFGGANGFFMTMLQLLTFEIVSGTLYLQEETQMTDDNYAGLNLDLAALDVNYRIYGGRFD